MDCSSLCKVFPFFLLLLVPSLSLNLDGTLLLSLKNYILSDPLSVLHNWNYNDATPCLWTGVACGEVVNVFGVPELYRVISLSLPNSELLGVVPQGLGFIPYLRTLDLSSNFFNGTLPDSLFRASELQVLSLSNNVISGPIPEISAKSLRILNLSDNALSGSIPPGITSLKNLTVVSLRSNYLSCLIPSGVQSIQVLDLSSNLLNGSLPADFGGENLKYLNLSSNNLSGLLPPQFATKIPRNATVDLSFNELSGEIPASTVLSIQKAQYYEGNSDLCGKPLEKLCSIPSTISSEPKVSTVNTSSPAIAAIPRTIDPSRRPNSPGKTTTSSSDQVPQQDGLKPGAVAGIAVGPIAGLGVLAAIFMYINHKRKKANNPTKQGPISTTNKEFKFRNDSEVSSTVTEKRNLIYCPCLNITNGEETSEATSSDSDENTNHGIGANHPQLQLQLQSQTNQQIKSERSLVMVDGETEIELETLLKASAYVLGSSGATIVYKAVLQDGAAFAVRRIGESRVQRLKEFETHVKAIARLQHQNIVRIRGFYWGDNEKLVIYDYIPNGSLANFGYRKLGSSPNHLSFDKRLNIAKGIANGLNFIHEKKQVHGNIKPSNILLTADMEPLISDFGLHWLIYGGKPAAPGCASPYRAPESLNHSHKPNPKWDVYSFGILLLELLTGRVFSDQELSRWAGGEEPNRVLRMADVEGREEATLAWAELGLRCASLVPQDRPSMKDAVNAMERIPCSC